MHSIGVEGSLSWLDVSYYGSGSSKKMQQKKQLLTDAQAIIVEPNNHEE